MSGPSTLISEPEKLDTGGMFIRYFIEIPRPSADVEELMLASPGSWAAAPAREAQDRRERLLAEVGFDAVGGRVDKRVEISFGEPVRFPSKTILPMSWKAVGIEALFPRLDADMEVAPLGPRRTQLSISAPYAPPLGSLGRILDRTLLHRVAEATVKDFLDRVGEAIQAPDAAQGRASKIERRMR